MVGSPEDPADLELTKSDMAKFEEETGIHVELDVIPIENVRTIVQTQLRSGDGPDVFGYDTGPGFAGALAEAGLVYPLTDAYEKYDWPVYDFAQERVTFDGEIVGIPNDIETLGLYYNATIFDELGIDRPREPRRPDRRVRRDRRRRHHPDRAQRPGGLAGRTLPQRHPLVRSSARKP